MLGISAFDTNDDIQHESRQQKCFAGSHTVFKETMNLNSFKSGIGKFINEIKTQILWPVPDIFIVWPCVEKVC